jgi:hypothetical protein
MKSEVEMNRYTNRALEENLMYERRIDHDSVTKLASYHNQATNKKLANEVEPSTLNDKHNNLKYSYVTSSIGSEKRPKEHERNMNVISQRYTNDENDHNSNTSIDAGIHSRFKNIHNSTPQPLTGPVKLPYISSNGSPPRNQIGGGSYNKIGSHHYSISESSNYAIGVGKTSSSNNLTATVSGGNFYLSGAAKHESRERIEFKCSATGNISKVSPTKSVSERDPPFNNYYHKFRQQNKTTIKADSKFSVSNSFRNKFPLPFTGIEHPFIDGGGVTSWGRDGIYANNKAFVKIYNDFEKSWLYSLPDKYKLTANDRPSYSKKKTKLENNTNKIVYDCVNSSPYYSSAYQAEHSSMIDLNRDYIIDKYESLEDRKSKTTGLLQLKDRYYSYLLPYYALENEFDNTLIFESRFESGNLRRAFK